ncbi:V-type ATP synthase subunit I [Anaerococcus sp. Marseille-P3625]|uniref:V-type ATP synthase subunit I n=1 Tax=Anaerococcus sp. Marseille-P3625 TaxID=1977277 RepID=UPI0021516C25|nr:V-type ATPase 116kDa subunit family protein [Anaerococcus sp. Marseille-P3625]
MKNKYPDQEMTSKNQMLNNKDKKVDSRSNIQADDESYLLIYPKKVKEDVSRSINTLGFLDKDTPDDSSMNSMDYEKSSTIEKLDEISKKTENLKSDNKEILDNLPYTLDYNNKAKELKNNMAHGSEYFYLSGKVPESKLGDFEKLGKKYPNTLISSKYESQDGESPPKTNKNNQYVKSNEENYLLIYPKQVREDVSRSINTLGFIDKDIPKDFLIDSIDDERFKTSQRLDEVTKEIRNINGNYQDLLENIPYSLDYSEKANNLKNDMAHGSDYFYLSGWVPESKLESFQKLESKHKNTLINSKEVSEVSEQPPTRLKNNPFVKPFEYMVNMYGPPSYNEIDPTPFFAITYMLLYGLMFGDLGQGLVFLGLGFWLSKKNETFGALLKRIGISASVFGLMYGSFFGREDLIPALLIKPFDNIMTVLIASVAFGVTLMVISYIIGIYNKVHLQKNIEEGIFGKEGLAGLMMMTAFIIIVLAIVNIGPIPKTIGLILLILSIVMIIFKQPIARKLEGNKRLYDQAKGDYYLEGSFSVIEALLSVFSNLVSFTRVGAFAINHVGLYMAFEVMAKLIGGGVKGFIILVIGNIFIIGLEGMIVGIQGLRLEFYEMFSKYYEGNGRLFRPISK